MVVTFHFNLHKDWRFHQCYRLTARMKICIQPFCFQISCILCSKVTVKFTIQFELFWILEEIRNDFSYWNRFHLWNSFSFSRNQTNEPKLIRIAGIVEKDFRSLLETQIGPFIYQMFLFIIITNSSEERIKDWTPKMAVRTHIDEQMNLKHSTCISFHIIQANAVYVRSRSRTNTSELYICPHILLECRLIWLHNF